MFKRKQKQEAAPANHDTETNDNARSAASISPTNVEEKQPDRQKTVEEPVAFPLPKSGDYQIQVHIIEASQLAPRDLNGVSDPVVEIVVCGKKQSTKIHKATTACVFDELFFFNCQLSAEEVASNTIALTAFDADTLMRNDLIGTFVFDMIEVYNTKNHEIFSQWVALVNNDNKTKAGITGYLRVSITVLGPGDVQKIHMESTDESTTDSNKISDMALLPPQIQLRTGWLVIRVHKAEGLPRMDLIGREGIDAYVKISFAHNKPVRTKVVTARSPQWYEEFQLPIFLPSMSDRVEVGVWDQDLIGSDELVGTLFFKYSELIRNPIHTPRWFGLYGAPLGTDNSAAKLMNTVSRDASFFRGRILLSLSTKPQDDDNPQEELVWGPKAFNVEPEPPTTSYFMLADVYSHHEIPFGRKYSMQLCIGSQEFSTAKVQVGDNHAAVWNERMQKELILPSDPASCPDIFLYLCKGSKSVRIAYRRFRFEEVLNWEFERYQGRPTWIILNKDPALKRFEIDQFQGVTLFRLAVCLAANRPSYISEPHFLETTQKEPFEIRAHIYQSRDLPAADSNGSVDPYVTVKMQGKTVKTEIVARNCDASWYQTLTLDVELPPLYLAAPILVQVLDHDSFSKDDFVGRFLVPPGDLWHDPRTVRTPHWYELSWDDMAEAGGGEILASFQILPRGPTIPRTIVPTIEPKLRTCWLEILLLGLRDLASYQLTAVQKPFVEFDLGDRRSISKVLRTAAVNRPSGKNPNFADVYRVKVQIPEREIFAPKLNVTVFDYRLAGMHKPVIATASISLSSKVPWSATYSPPSSQLAATMESLMDDALAEKPPTGSFVTDERRLSEIAIRTAGDVPQPVKETVPAVPAQQKRLSAETVPGNSDEAVASSIQVVDSDIRVMAAEEDEDCHEDVPLLQNESVLSSHLDQDDQPFLRKHKHNRKVTVAPKDTSTELRIDIASAVSNVMQRLPRPPKALFNSKTIEQLLSEHEDRNPDASVPVYMKGRMTIDNELELALETTPFETYTLYRGQKRGHTRKAKSTYRSVGKLKGIIRILTDEKAAPLLDLNQLQNHQNYKVRVYVLRGLNLMPKDYNGKSDPYLKIKLGKQIISDEHNFIRDTLEPEFFRSFELTTTIPGAATLDIEVWDHDQGDFDDLIGCTKIDLEDRWFDKRWHDYAQKPVEHRPLFCPTSKNPQGKLELWVDIMPEAEARRVPMLNITPPPPEPWELRVIVWQTKDVVPKDTITDQNDLFMRCWMEGSEKQDTDIHWRCERRGSFNWRLKFDLMLPMKFPRFYLQAWDKDILLPNEVAAERVLNLKPMFDHAFHLHTPYHLTDGTRKANNNKQWIELFGPGGSKCAGFVEISIELLPKAVATARPAGFGRSEPNMNPYLPPPVGRFNFSLLNPCATIQGLLGKKLTRKLCCCVCLLFCCALFAMILPSVIGALVSKGLDQF
eukprot:GILK01012542.1.p1 GENE.GILK01012542.1~~GILK01012542.1.p1  ORF type:complete len:1447 (-),score=299.86 GILK01012542.1:238-4578(-)